MRTFFLRYGIALFVVVTALVLTLLVMQLMEQATLLLFLGAIIISSRMGARGPGLLATLLSALACAYLLLLAPSQRMSMSTGSERGDVAAFVVFVLVAALVNSVNIARERAEEARRRAESKYQGIFENAITGIYQTTPAGRYLAANPMLARMFGYESAKQMIETAPNLNEQFYVDPERRAEFIRLVSEQDSVTGFESQIYRRDKSKFTIAGIKQTFFGIYHP